MTIDRKKLVNVLYYSAAVSGLAIDYSRFSKIVIGSASPKLHATRRKQRGCLFRPRDSDEGHAN